MQLRDKIKYPVRAHRIYRSKYIVLICNFVAVMILQLQPIIINPHLDNNTITHLNLITCAQSHRWHFLARCLHLSRCFTPRDTHLRIHGGNHACVHTHRYYEFLYANPRNASRAILKSLIIYSARRIATSPFAILSFPTTFCMH